MLVTVKSCKKCSAEKPESDFYSRDKTCKECRKAMVRDNRAIRADYYREYDRQRFKTDPKVKERHKRYQATEKGKESIKRANARYLSINPVKRAAHVILGNAVRDGKLAKPAFCELCGSAGRVHGHHDDYAFPLAVRWLCSKCHASWHAEHGEAKNG